MEIRDFIFKSVAKAFGIDESEITMETNLLDDLHAKSVNFFPIMNELEDEYDLDLQYQTFRTECPTIKSIIEMVEEEA